MGSVEEDEGLCESLFNYAEWGYDIMTGFTFKKIIMTGSRLSMGSQGSRGVVLLRA